MLLRGNLNRSLQFHVGNMKSRVLALLLPRNKEKLRRFITTLVDHVGEFTVLQQSK